MVPEGARVADIGTDHGILARILVTARNATHCIASELRSERFSGFRGLPPHHPLAERLELRSGDGLDVLAPSDGVEVVTMTGIGARTMLRILGRAAPAALGVRRFVLQPQSEWAELRAGLPGLGLGIVAERMVEERGRFYVVIAAEPGAPSLPVPAGLTSQEALEAGPGLLASREPIARLYWRRQLEHHDRILARAMAGRGYQEARRKRDLWKRVLAALPG